MRRKKEVKIQNLNLNQETEGCTRSRLHIGLMAFFDKWSKLYLDFNAEAEIQILKVI